MIVTERRLRLPPAMSVRRAAPSSERYVESLVPGCHRARTYPLGVGIGTTSARRPKLKKSFDQDLTPERRPILHITLHKVEFWSGSFLEAPAKQGQARQNQGRSRISLLHLGRYEPVFGGTGRRLGQRRPPHGAIYTPLHIKEYIRLGVRCLGDGRSGDSKPLVLLGDFHRRLLSAVRGRDGYRTVFCLRSCCRLSDRVLAAAAAPIPGQQAQPVFASETSTSRVRTVLLSSSSALVCRDTWLATLPNSGELCASAATVGR